MIIQDKFGFHIKKASALLITPYEFNNDVNDFVLGKDTFDVTQIVANTIEVLQDESDITSKNNDLEYESIIDNVVMGMWHFSTECININNILFELFFNGMIGSNSNGDVDGAIVMPNKDYEKYFMIHIVLSDNIPDIVLPKVRVYTDFNIRSLKNDISRVKINGIAKEKQFIVFKEKQALRFRFGKMYETYSPTASMFFLPKNYLTAVSKFDSDNSENEVYIEEINGVNFSLNSKNGNLINVN